MERLGLPGHFSAPEVTNPCTYQENFILPLELNTELNAKDENMTYNLGSQTYILGDEEGKQGVTSISAYNYNNYGIIADHIQERLRETTSTGVGGTKETI